MSARLRLSCSASARRWRPAVFPCVEHLAQNAVSRPLGCCWLRMAWCMPDWCEGSARQVQRRHGCRMPLQWLAQGCDTEWLAEGRLPAVQAEQMEADLDVELEALEVELASTLCEDTHVRCTPGRSRCKLYMPAECTSGLWAGRRAVSRGNTRQNTCSGRAGAKAAARAPHRTRRPSWLRPQHRSSRAGPHVCLFACKAQLVRRSASSLS